MANRYWVAIIGPVDDKLIQGTDAALRFDLETSAGEQFDAVVPCNSCWVSEAVKEKIMAAKYTLPETTT